MGLLILGAGVRAAAFSAIRLGLRPDCADLFGDARPQGLELPFDPDRGGGLPRRAPRVRGRGRAIRWLYTGALENRPDLVDAISERHRLLGNPGSVLRRLRDPDLLSETIREAGLVAPEVRLDPVGIAPRRLPGSGSRSPRAADGASGRGSGSV